MARVVTAQSIIQKALKAANVIGTGQTPLAEDSNDTFDLLAMLMGEWNQNRWMVYHEIDLACPSTGAQFYTIGPGGDINIPSRPSQIKAAYFRQIIGNQHATPLAQNQNSVGIEIQNIAGDVAPIINSAVGNFAAQGAYNIDYPLEIIKDRETYSRIALKTLTSFSSYLFWDNAFPLGNAYPWPILLPSIYELHLVFQDALAGFPTLTSTFQMPPEYELALYLSLAELIIIHYAIVLEPELSRKLEKRAAAARNAIIQANTQISRLRMPEGLINRGHYNVFSDQIR